MLTELCDEVNSCLTNNGIDMSSISGLSDLFSHSSVYANPFAGLLSQHMQLKFFTKDCVKELI